MSTEHWWNDIYGGKPKYSENNLCQCHFIHRKSHMDWSGIEPGPPQPVSILMLYFYYRADEFYSNRVSKHWILFIQ
jgi:hypothetical protein